MDNFVVEIGIIIWGNLSIKMALIKMTFEISV